MLKGELGFPHRGFPKAVEDAILKGQSKLTVRVGLLLPPVNLEENIATLSAKFKANLSPEQAMSYLMYPKVFSDYFARQQSRGNVLISQVPSPVYFYGAAIGHKFTISLDNKTISLTLLRATPLRQGMRSLIWSVDGVEHSVEVKDHADVFVFDGPMAEVGNPNHASPINHLTYLSPYLSHSHIVDVFSDARSC